MTHPPPPPPPPQGCCRCILSFTLTSALTAFFLWLSLRPHYPTCSIEQFHVFALNNPNPNRTVVYDLKLNNRNKDEGVYYDALNLTFYYKYNNTNSSSTYYYPIGGGTYSGFYQGHGKNTHRAGVAVLTSGVKWEKDALETALKNGVAVFRAELETAVRFRIVFWKTRRRRLVVGGDLKVDDHGELVKRKKNKGIKLSNDGGFRLIWGWFKVVISLISVVVVVHL